MDKESRTIRAEVLANSDGELVRACRAREIGAWEELVHRFQRLVFAIPRRAGLDETQAQDIFQDVFLTLFQKLDTLEDSDKIRAWLVTTAKFRTWHAIRSRHGHYSPATEEEMEREMTSLPDRSPLADDMLVELEQQQQIRTTLEIMGEPCRSILRMIYMQEPAASYAEVAEAIGAAATGISPMRARCLKKLEKLLSA